MKTKKFKAIIALMVTIVMVVGLLPINMVSANDDENYTISLKLSGNTSDYNAGDEIRVDVILQGGGATNTGSLQFGITGDWFDLANVVAPNGAEVQFNTTTKQVAITGLNEATATGATVATLTLKVHSDISTTANAEINFGSSGNYITPIGSLKEIIPNTTGTTVNIHNIKVTLNSGNGIFNRSLSQSLCKPLN